MARRESDLIVNIETVDSTNFSRLVDLVLQIESVDSTNYCRLSDLVVMIEYIDVPVTNDFNPRWQIMN